MPTPQETLATQVARRFIERYDANDIAGAVALLADDAQYWLAGKPDELSPAGLFDKAGIKRLFERMIRRQVDGQRMWVTHSTTEGSRVALEVESLATLTNGRRYNNAYHMLFEVNEAGRIVRVKEYFDTHHVWNVWHRPEHGGDSRTADTPAA